MNAACVPCPSPHLLFTLAVKQGSAGHFLMSFGDSFVILHGYVVLLLPCSVGTELGGHAELSKHHWNWSSTVHLGMWAEWGREPHRHNPYKKTLSASLEHLCKHLCLNKCCPSGYLFRQKLKEKGMFACIGIYWIFPVLIVFCSWIFKKKIKRRKRRRKIGRQWEAFSCIHSKDRMFTLNWWIYLKQLQSEDKITLLDTHKS